MPVTNIRDYNITSSDVFFFDNNVWMYLFCPIGNHNANKQKKYSAFFNTILTHKATIYLNSLVLSEFANASLRLDYNLWKKSPGNFGKDYKRDYLVSDQFKATVGSVQSAIRQILKRTVRMNDNYNSVDIEKILNNFSSIDFNDSYLIEYCNSCGHKILFLTDDKDFSRVDCGSLSIITAS